MADEQPAAPLSAAALDAIRRNIDNQLREQRAAYVTDAHSMARLLATLDAAIAERDAMREIVAAVAAKASADGRNVPLNRRCLECGVYGHEPLEHEPDCLADRARGLLDGTPAPE